jgi:hypothetical protein
MNCPSCKGTNIKLDVSERNCGISYFDDAQCTDSSNFECIESWLTKGSAFFCEDCTIEDDIKFLEGKLPYPVKDRWGKSKVKLIRKDWHKAGRNRWRKNIQKLNESNNSTKKSSCSAEASM